MIAIIASLIVGSSVLTEQPVKAQNITSNMTEKNNANDTALNESGTISSHNIPVRPPFVVDSDDS